MRRGVWIGVVIMVFLMPSLLAQRLSRPNLTVLFEPELRAKLPEEVHESSGLFFHNGRLWTHNDDGKNILYALDTATFEVVQRVTLTNAKSRDWEDVCTDGERVYVGDFGNNRGKRWNLRIYMFPLSALPPEGDASITVDSIRFLYEDQTDFTSRRRHDFDCESIFATEHYLYLLSKGWKTGTSTLYRLDKKPGAQFARRVDHFNSYGLVTGADYDPESGILALVGYVNDVWVPFIYLIYDFYEPGAINYRHRFEMEQHVSTQIEGICFFDKGKCFISAETSPTVTTRVFVADFNTYIEKDQNRLNDETGALQSRLSLIKAARKNISAAKKEISVIKDDISVVNKNLSIIRQ